MPGTVVKSDTYGGRHRVGAARSTFWCSSGRIAYMTLRYDLGHHTIQELLNLQRHRQLNLEPAFQRESVWTPADRKKLVDSILNGVPIPSIFLYKRTERNRLVYDVIDGKQRLESICMFLVYREFAKELFSVRTRVDNSERPVEVDWPELRRLKTDGQRVSTQFLGTRIPTVEVSGDLSDIIDVFIRINSTGKRLTGAEKRHARYFSTDFMHEAERLAARYRAYFVNQRVLQTGQISRMKHVELVCELLASLANGGPINKKDSLDRVIGGQGAAGRALVKARKEFVHTMGRVQKMFPRLRETRFRNSVDFYSLFMIIWEMERDGLVLNDPRRNRQAQQLLIAFGNGVDSVRDRLRRGEGARATEAAFRDYLLTVGGDTDSQATRRRRAALLRKLLGGLFEAKDTRRGFTAEQRRLIWHASARRRCGSCHEELDWTNFTIDHIKPHARGGLTIADNAALLCRSCNARKGARPTRVRSASRRRASSMPRRPIRASAQAVGSLHSSERTRSNLNERRVLPLCLLPRLTPGRDRRLPRESPTDTGSPYR